MRETRTRQHYAKRTLPDNLTKAGAEGLANTIRAFWYRQGKFPNVNILKQSTTGTDTAGEGIFVVRSSIINGMPQ